VIFSLSLRSGCELRKPDRKSFSQHLAQSCSAHTKAPEVKGVASWTLFTETSLPCHIFPGPNSPKCWCCETKLRSFGSMRLRLPKVTKAKEDNLVCAPTARPPAKGPNCTQVMNIYQNFTTWYWPTYQEDPRHQIRPVRLVRRKI